MIFRTKYASFLKSGLNTHGPRDPCYHLKVLKTETEPTPLLKYPILVIGSELHPPMDLKCGPSEILSESVRSHSIRHCMTPRVGISSG